MIRSLFSILFLAGAIAIFFLYTSPAYDSMQALSTQGAQYDAALEKATQLQELKQTLLARDNSFDPTEVSRLTTMLPDQVDNIRLILDLDNLASKYGMGLQNVQISSPDTDQGQSVVSSIASAAQPYDSLTLSFTTAGTYQQFIQFVTALQSSLRLVDIENISFQPTAGAANSSADVYTYTMTVQTYWLR